MTQYDVHQGTSIAGGRISGRGLGWSYDTIGNRLTETKKSVRTKNEHGYSTSDQIFSYVTNSLNQYTQRDVPTWAEVSGTTDTNHLVTAVQGTGTNLLANRALRTHEFFHIYAQLRQAGESDAVASQLALYTVDPGAGTFDPGPGVHRDLVDVEQLKVKLQANTENFLYDARGNLVQDGWFTYSWDAENRLVGVAHKSGIISLVSGGTLDLTPIKLSFRYDHMGRRYSKESFTWLGSSFSSQPSQQTLFYYDGWNLLEEITYDVSYTGSSLSSASLSQDKRYYWGLDWSGSLSGAGGVGGLVGFTHRNAGESFSTLAYPSFDGTGNVMGLYQADGTTLAQYEYSPYGKILREEGSWASLNPFRFQTKQYDDETDLTYYQHRYYSASLGRFLSQDPLGTEGGLNLYAFVNNSPLNSFDFLGLYGVGDFFGAIGSAVGGVIGSIGGAIWDGISGASGFVWDKLLAPTFDAFYTYGIEPTFDFALGLGTALLFPRADPQNASLAYRFCRAIGGTARSGLAGYVRFALIPFRWATHEDYAESGASKETLRDLSMAPYFVAVRVKDPRRCGQNSHFTQSIKDAIDRNDR